MKRKKDRVFSFPFSFFSFFFLFFLVFFRKPLRVKISLALDDFASRFKSKASGIRAQRIVRPLVFNVRRLKRSFTRPTDIQESSRHANILLSFSLSFSLYFTVLFQYVSTHFLHFITISLFFSPLPLSFDAINLFPLIRFDQVESLPLYTFFPLLPVAI